MTDPKYKYGLRMSGQKRFGTVGEVSGLFLYRRCFRKDPTASAVILQHIEGEKDDFR